MDKLQKVVDALDRYSPNQNVLAFICISLIYFFVKFYHIFLVAELELAFIISIIIFLTIITLSMSIYSLVYVFERLIGKYSIHQNKVGPDIAKKVGDNKFALLVALLALTLGFICNLAAAFTMDILKYSGENLYIFGGVLSIILMFFFIWIIYRMAR